MIALPEDGAAPVVALGTYRYSHCRRDQWLSVRPRKVPRGTAEEACLFDAPVDRQWMCSHDTKKVKSAKIESQIMPNVRDTLVPI